MPLPDSVKGALDDVLSENQEKILHFWQTAGGWEGWLQCELSYRLMQSEVTIEREVDVWNSGEKADLYLSDARYISNELVSRSGVTLISRSRATSSGCYTGRPDSTSYSLIAR